jgi:two-component system response regulator AtoC
MFHTGGTVKHEWLADIAATDLVHTLGQLVPGVAVVGTDAAGNVVVWSSEAERLLGWRREEVLGRPCPCGDLADADGRGFGARIRAHRADGTPVCGRHYRHAFGPPDAPLGSLHVFVAADEGADAPDVDTDDAAVEFHGLVTRDPALLRVFQTVRTVADTDATVLVRGESGTGKELVARAIHAESDRRNRPFVAVNCAAFAPSLLESELFGHVKGAFTGAVSEREGIFAQADGGVLFLDEVGELSIELQAKLLRILEERAVVPVGGHRRRPVDVRVVAATHRSLREEVKAGRFREDLLFRLRVVPLFLPALRERPGDIELLLSRSIQEHNRRGRRQVRAIHADTRRQLLAHPWPGNVRELQNVVAYAFAVGVGPELVPDDLPPEFREGARARETGDDDIQRALAAAGGDLDEAARRLGLSRTTFWRRRKRLGLVHDRAGR